VSIRSRLLLLVLAATLIPLSLVAWRFVAEREKEIDVAIGRLALAADDLGNALDERIQGTAQLLYGLARARDLDTTDRGACSAFLSAVREEYPQYTGILTANPDGALFCDSLGTGRELNFRDRQYFRQALNAPDGISLQPVFGRLTGVSVLQIAHPVRAPSGELKRVLLASFNLEKFATDHPVRDAEILIASFDGTVLVRLPTTSRGPPKGSLLGQDPVFAFAEAHGGGGSEEIVGADGDRQVWAAAKSAALRRAGLYVLVGQSKKNLVAAANRRFAQDMIAGTTIALFLILGIWLLAELGIRRQVTRINRMARQLGAGDLEARIPAPHPDGELGGLMTVLNATAQSLESQHAAIEDLNQKLRQSQKMEAVGQLTGGIAHDFNNILTVIIANTEALQQDTAVEPVMAERLEQIMLSADRAADLTKQLLAFSRKQALRPQRTNINDLVTTTRKLLQRTLGEQIEIDAILARGLWAVSIDRAQLENALVNLCLNARDAMPNGGKLLIETGNVVLDEAYASSNSDIPAGRYAMIAVTDSGTGIPQELIEKVFEPFFTTKEVGKGTGLGLSMVYGFIKQSNGHIKIYSEEGHGTSIKLYLPQSEGPSEKEAVSPNALLTGGSERILVVEDDPQVRLSVVNQLRSLGYAVSEASNGPAGVAVLEAAPQPFDLLLSDVVMPGPLKGKTLGDLVAARWPATKVVFISGYTEDAVVHHGRLDAGVMLLTKPFRKSDLASFVRQALDGGARLTPPPESPPC
jgi:signal transduction histidine kinase